MIPSYMVHKRTLQYKSAAIAGPWFLEFPGTQGMQLTKGNLYLFDPFIPTRESAATEFQYLTGLAVFWAGMDPDSVTSIADGIFAPAWRITPYWAEADREILTIRVGQLTAYRVSVLRITEFERCA